MEPLCPLLLVGFSLPLARALRGNETTADSNETTTTSGPPDPGASQPLLAWLLLPLLLLLLVLLLAAYFFRFRKQRKAVVSTSDKKMPNGILEEQAKGDAAQQVTLRAQEVFSHPRGAPGGGDPYQIRRRLQAVSGGVQLIAIWTHTRNF
ncbi:protein tyrosine phosphatase receptor type E [Homo sapiens]|uniref:Protein tyrosine phosphatase receptor type E n=1 Tax=Homo sapiens TaxID=9606 RepID=S4R3B0_HUMAN|nr:protein tyrosine phosphatase receptor type E [Homo sapiens]KAI4077834.1 protein tyrosine phosphatase receptor type E [Homo sapiens]